MPHKKKKAAGGNRTASSKNSHYFDNSSASQRQRLIEHLAKHPKGCTTVELRRAIDVMHPAGRVCELRSRGFNILTFWDTDDSEGGRPRRMARYVLLAQGGGNA